MSIRASKQAVMMGLDEPSLQAALAGQNAFPAVAAMYRSADFKEGAGCVSPSSARRTGRSWRKLHCAESLTAAAQGS